MNISVLIPSYNSATTIEAAIDSVLSQTLPADEVIILVDGSTDDTMARLQRYRGRVTILEQSNRGISYTRNKLVSIAQGRLLAFLDADDIWHPKYLEVQYNSFLKHPHAVAFFTGHEDFKGAENFIWKNDIETSRLEEELIAPTEFFRRYNQATGPFASMTYCCVPKAMFERLGKEPFCLMVGGVEDSYLLYVLCLHGPVSYTAAPLAAYRIWGGSISQNRLKILGLWVKVFELLEGRYRQVGDPKMQHEFQQAFAAKRRRYGKLLMGAGRTVEARKQFRAALKISVDYASKLKSLALWLVTRLPTRLHPVWPSGDRESGDRTMNFRHPQGLLRK